LPRRDPLVGGKQTDDGITRLAQGALEFTEQAAPANPGAGYLRLYAGTDDAIYQKDSAGNAIKFSGSTHTHTHAATTGQGVDDHHAKSHTHSGDGSGTIADAALGSGTPDGTKFLRDDRTWQAPSGGAPTTADYLVGTAQAGLSAEIVVGATPGGELGGTWGTPTVDATHSGSAHHTRAHDHSNASDGSALVPASLNVSGKTIQSGIIVPALSGNVNDWAPAGLATATIVTVDLSSASRTVTGISATGLTEGQVFLICPYGGGAGTSLTLSNNSTSSLSGNRFTNPGAADVVVRNGGGVRVVYLPTKSAAAPFTVIAI